MVYYESRQTPKNLQESAALLVHEIPNVIQDKVKYDNKLVSSNPEDANEMIATYEVREGDTLTSIRKNLNNNENRSELENPNYIVVGQT